MNQQKPGKQDGPITSAECFDAARVLLSRGRVNEAFLCEAIGKQREAIGKQREEEENGRANANKEGVDS